MKYKHTKRPGFLLGFIDFFTAGLFFLMYMPLGGLQKELEEILGHKVQPYWQAYLLGVPTLFIYTLGTNDSLLKVAENFERLGEYEKTAKAIRDYFAGNKNAKHNIAYREIPVLELVKFIKRHDSVLENIEWDHRNTWDFRYRMKADRVSVSQILISYDFKFRRCIRAEFTGLCYEGLRGEWIELDGGFWGHGSIFDRIDLPSGKKVYHNMLYAEEDESDVLWELEQKITDSDKIKFDSICDEIFADG